MLLVAVATVVTKTGCSVGRHVWNDVQSRPHPHFYNLKYGKSWLCIAEFILREGESLFHFPCSVSEP